MNKKSYIHSALGAFATNFTTTSSKRGDSESSWGGVVGERGDKKRVDKVLLRKTFLAKMEVPFCR